MDTPIRFGLEAKTRREVLVPLSLFERHAWFQGMTGSGKSTLLKFILAQILKTDDAAVVVVDFGGDQFLFNGVMEVAKAKSHAPSREFKFISMNPEHAWNAIDMFRPFVPLTYHGLPLLVGYIQTVFGLEYGEGYGYSYHSRVNAASLRRIFNSFLEADLLSPTIETFATSLAATAKHLKFRDTSEAQLVSESLLNYPQLLPSEIPGHDIDVLESLERGDVIYGLLGSLTDPGAKLIGSILAWSFIYAAIHRYTKGLTPKRLYLVIDEYPMVSGSKQFEELFTMARKFNVSIIALTQTSQQLRTQGQDSFHTLWDNTAVKVWLTPTDPDDVERLRSISKDVVMQKGNSSTSISDFRSSSSFSEAYEPKLLRNQVIDVAFTGQEGFLIANDMQGHHEPIHFRFEPDWTLDDYKRLSRTPIPSRPTPLESSRGTRDGEYDTRQKAIDTLLASKRGAELWKETNSS